MTEAAITDITLTAFASVCVFCYTWWKVSKLKYLSNQAEKKVDRI